MDYQPACYQCRKEADKDAAGVKESSLCIPHLRARNIRLADALERYVRKFGDCGDVYNQGCAALREEG